MNEKYHTFRIGIYFLCTLKHKDLLCCCYNIVLFDGDFEQDVFDSSCCGFISGPVAESSRTVAVFCGLYVSLSLYL